jgi:hypothetical protein
VDRKIQHGVHGWPLRPCHSKATAADGRTGAASVHTPATSHLVRAQLAFARRPIARRRMQARAVLCSPMQSRRADAAAATLEPRAANTRELRRAVGRLNPRAVAEGGPATARDIGVQESQHLSAGRRRRPFPGRARSAASFRRSSSVPRSSNGSTRSRDRNRPLFRSSSGAAATRGESATLARTFANRRPSRQRTSKRGRRMFRGTRRCRTGRCGRRTSPADCPSLSRCAGSRGRATCRNARLTPPRADRSLAS